MFTGGVFNSGTGNTHSGSRRRGPGHGRCSECREQGRNPLPTTWQILAVEWDSNTLAASLEQLLQGICLLHSKTCNVGECHTPIFTNITITGTFVSHVASTSKAAILPSQDPFQKVNHQTGFTEGNAQQFIMAGFYPCTKGMHKSVLPTSQNF